MKLNDLLALSVVPRWTIVPMFRQQTVAEHTFRTAIIFVHLCEQMNVFPTVRDLELVLEHDGPESHSGDIPTPFKNELGEDQIRIAEDVKCPWYIYPRDNFSDDRVCDCFDAADLIEQYTWLRAWGNGPLAKRVLLRVAGRLMDLHLDQGIVNATVAKILDEEDRYGGRGEASR